MPAQPRPRMTLATLLVLRVLADQADRDTYGFEVVRATGLPSGTVYPMLGNLEDRGWLKGKWERVNAHQAGRPPRYYYRLTKTGLALAQAVLSETRVKLTPAED